MCSVARMSVAKDSFRFALLNFQQRVGLFQIAIKVFNGCNIALVGSHDRLSIQVDRYGIFEIPTQGKLLAIFSFQISGGKASGPSDEKGSSCNHFNDTVFQCSYNGAVVNQEKVGQIV